MKKIMNLAAVAMTVLAFASCAKEQIVSDANVKREAKLVVTATNGTKTFLSLGKNISWVKADKLIGFNEKGDQYVSEGCQMEIIESTGKERTSQSSGKFSFTEWTGVPKYFMFNFAEGNNPYAGAAVNGEQVEAYVNEKQRAQDDKISFCRWSPVLVGVASKMDDSEVYTTTLANVTAFLKVSFGYCSTVQSLKISSKEGVDLAGKVAISTSSIEAREPAIIEVLEGKKDIVLTVSNSAGKDVESAAGKMVKCFNVGSTYAYYISVIPGKFTPVLTFTDVNGNEYTKEGSVTAEVKRGEYYDLGVIDASLCFNVPEGVRYPQTLVFNLGKTWNFNEEAPKEGEYSGQKAGKASENYYGETYTYCYKDAETGFEEDYLFKLCKYYKEEKEGYGYYYDSTKGLVFLKAGAMITLPAIDRYKVTRIEIECDKAIRVGSKFAFINDDTDARKEYFVCKFETGRGVFESQELKANTNYFIYLPTSSNIAISDLKITYSSDFKLGFDYEIFSEGSKYVSPNGNPFTGLKASLATSSDSPFNLEGFEFTPQTGTQWCWNSNFGFYCNSNAHDDSSPVPPFPARIKLPKIEGYKLAKVSVASRQDNRNFAICSGVGENPLVEIASGKTIGVPTDGGNGITSVIVGDPYDAAKDYYYEVRTKNTGFCKFILTYKPI